MIAAFSYIYYKKFIKSKGPSDEEEEGEVEELREDSDRGISDKEWEEKRFSKMRYIGNSTFISWKLIKKVKIIEGMSMDVKVAP